MSDPNRPLHRINEMHKGTLSSDRVAGLDAALAEIETDITALEASTHDPVTVGTGLDVTGQLVELDLSEVAAGGELGGTMDAPTVDASHSGSTHAATAAAAVVTADAYTDTAISGEVTRADAAYQPKDSDLTAIAALTTTAFGRALLELANAAAGRTAFALGTAATSASTDFQPIDSDLTAIAALTTTAFGRTFLDLADAAAARTKLGLGTAALSATGDFDAAGAAAAAQAASQPLDSDLTAFAALAIAADKLPYGSGSHALSLADFTAAGRALIDDADAAAQRTTLGLGTAATHATGDYDAAGAAAAAQSASQPLDATLTALAALATGVDKLPYATGTDTFSQAAFTAAGRALVDDADAAAQRVTLGLGTAATSASGDFQPADADLTAIAALATDAFGRDLLIKTTAAAVRTYIGLGTLATASAVAHVDTTGQTATDHHAAPVAGPDADVTIGAAGAAGTAATFARSQHGHKVPSYSSTPGADTVAGSAGTDAAGVSRGDHIHPGVESRASMPGSPVLNQRVWRTDLNLEFYYDGTRWLSSVQFVATHDNESDVSPLSASSSVPERWAHPGVVNGLDIWVETVSCTFFVNTGGTALSGSHKWVGVFSKADSTNAQTTIATHTIASGASGAWRRDNQTVGASVVQATYFAFQLLWTKTGTPGSLAIAGTKMIYRFIGT